MSMIYPWLQSSFDAMCRDNARGHAFLLLGVEGLGQPALVDAMAKHWLSTQHIQDHPDICRVERIEGKRDISVDQIRDVNEWVQQTAHGHAGRVVIIHHLERLNTAAANSLLKTLEEPPQGVRFLLTAARAGRLLPTILSRCQRWVLPVPSEKEGQQWLQAQVATASEDDVRTALALHFGAPLMAHEWLVGTGLAQWRAWQKIWQQVTQQGSLTAPLLHWAREDMDRFLSTLSAQAHLETANGSAAYGQLMRLCWQAQKMLKQNMSKELVMDQMLIALSQALAGQFPQTRFSRRRGALA